MVCRLVYMWISSFGASSFRRFLVKATDRSCSVSDPYFLGSNHREDAYKHVLVSHNVHQHLALFLRL